METKNYFSTDAAGNIIPGAQVYVNLPGTSSPAPGITNINGAPLANPFTAASSGLVQFKAPDGEYDLRVVGGGREFTIRIQCFDGVAFTTTFPELFVADNIEYGAGTVADALDEFEAMLARSVKVEDYGILPGTTSVLDRLQELTNEISSTGGGVILFGRGGFNITGYKPPTNVIPCGAGRGATLLNYAGEPGLAGIEFIHRATSYNFAGLRDLTLYNTGSFGLAAVKTPVITDAFTRTLRLGFSDLDIRGVSANSIHMSIGDCSTGFAQKIWIQGPYVAQNPDAGQPDDLGIQCKGERGVVNFDISAYKMRGVRRALNVSDFGEGFSIHDGEIVGSYDGIVCDSNPSKPGGFIHDNHMNCSHRCVILNRRRHITMHGNQYYRDASFIPNHTLGWKAVEILNSGGIKTGSVQTRPGVGFTDGNVGVSVTDSPDVQIAEVSCGEIGTMATALQVTASAIDLCKGVSLGGITADTLPTWVEINGAVNDFKLADNVNERGTASTSPIVFNGTGAEKSSIKLPKTSTAVPEYIPYNVTAAGNLAVKARVHPPTFDISCTAGSGAYIRNVYVDRAGAVDGDSFVAALTIIGGSQATVNFYDGALGATPAPTLRKQFVALAAGTNLLREIEMKFNGTGWRQTTKILE